jgi:hypothetical protein
VNPEQSVVSAIHPAPVVTHPAKNCLHYSSEVNVESAYVQALFTQLVPPVIHQHLLAPELPVNLPQISVDVPGYAVQASEGSMQPVPLVKHPL